MGSKITKYRRQAEGALDKIATYVRNLPGKWTAGVTLPVGDFSVNGVPKRVAQLKFDYAFLSPAWEHRLFRAYDTDARAMLGNATAQEEFPHHFSASGWVKHDPSDPSSTTIATGRAAIEGAALGTIDIVAIGITNQRETTLVWDLKQANRSAAPLFGKTAVRPTVDATCAMRATTR